MKLISCVCLLIALLLFSCDKDDLGKLSMKERLQGRWIIDRYRYSSELTISGNNWNKKEAYGRGHAGSSNYEENCTIDYSEQDKTIVLKNCWLKSEHWNPNLPMGEETSSETESYDFDLEYMVSFVSDSTVVFCTVSDPSSCLEEYYHK